MKKRVIAAIISLGVFVGVGVTACVAPDQPRCVEYDD